MALKLLICLPHFITTHSWLVHLLIHGKVKSQISNSSAHIQRNFNDHIAADILICKKLDLVKLLSLIELHIYFISRQLKFQFKYTHPHIVIIP